MEKEPVVFMSYKTIDKNSLTRLVDYLESNQINCRYAPRDFIGGKKYTDQITEEIVNNIDSVIVFITENTADSEHVAREINLAQTYNKPIIPILFELDQLPRNFEYSLSLNHWIPLTEEFQEEHLNNIINSIGYYFSGNHESQLFDKRASSFTKIGDVAVYEIESNLIKQVKEHYIKPPKYQLVEQLLNTYHCVVLQNQEKVGKFTTAIHLLNLFGYENIYMWPNNPPLKKIMKANFDKNIACIIEIEDIESFIKQVTDFEINQWLKKLETNNCHFIFTLKEESPELLSHLSVKLSSPVEVELLIKKQLEANIIDSNEINSLLNEMKKNGIIEQTILPKDAIKLSKQMVNVLTGVTPKEIFLQSHMNKSIERIDTWFNENYSIKSLSLFLLTAIFDGKRYSEIEFHSKELLRAFEKYETLTSEKADLMNLNEKFASFNAFIKESSNTTINSSRTVHLTYSNDGFALWKTIWYQYPEFRNPIMDWACTFLKNCALWKQEKLIQIFTELIKLDFNEGIYSIVYRLIKTNQRSLQLIALDILNKLYETEDYKYKTYKQVVDWLEKHKSEVVYETCIKALSTNIGKENLNQTLNLIIKMINSNHKAANDYRIQNLISNLMNMMRVNDIYAEMIINFWKDCREILSNTFDYSSLALKVFNARQHLIVLASNRIIKEFWSEILANCYENPASREATLKLIENVMDQTQHLKHYSSVARLIVYIHIRLQKNQYVNEASYFTKFIDRKLQHMSKSGLHELPKQIEQLLIKLRKR